MALKDDIIQESLKLLSLNGFLNTGVNDILLAAHTSKGGFYNHFSSKEDLFHHVLAEAQRIWRKKVLAGLDDLDSPLAKVKKILVNYRDQYLKDTETFPGGCIFITLSVELDDSRPHLAAEVNKGLMGFKRLLKRLLDAAQTSGELRAGVNTDMATEILFAGMLGASVAYGVDKPGTTLDNSIGALLDYLDEIKLERDISDNGAVYVADIHAP